MRTKKKFITIKPKTPEAVELFEYSMLGLQSCELLETSQNRYHLKPIKADYTFWMKLKDDDNWEIEK
jgi:hypothetical protein